MDAADYKSVGRRPDGRMFVRVWLLHQLGRLFGVQFHIGAWPYGAAWSRAINNNHAPQDECEAYASSADGSRMGIKKVWASLS